MFLGAGNLSTPGPGAVGARDKRGISDMKSFGDCVGSTSRDTTMKLWRKYVALKAQIKVETPAKKKKKQASVRSMVGCASSPAAPADLDVITPAALGSLMKDDFKGQ